MRGSLRRRGPSWTITLDLGYVTDPTSGGQKRKQKCLTFQAKGPETPNGLTEKQAEEKMAKLIAGVSDGNFVEPSKLTLGAWLSEWLDRKVTANTLSPSTVSKYRVTAARVKDCAIGRTPLQRLTPSLLEAYYAELSKTLAPATVGGDHTVIHQALKTAVRDRFIIRNAASETEGRPKKPKSQGGRNAWTIAEARAFLAAADAEGPQAAAFYHLAIDTGARLRELAGLQWADFDMDRGRLRIHRQLRPGATLAPQWGPTKTRESRDLIVTPETLSRLRAHRQHQAEIKLRNRKQYADFGLMFAKEHSHVRLGKDSLGQPLQVNNIGEREYGRLIKAANVRRIRFHDLRHTSATLALAAGEPVHEVSARLGHSKASMTLDIYAHALEGRQPEALRRALFG